MQHFPIFHKTPTLARSIHQYFVFYATCPQKFLGLANPFAVGRHHKKDLNCNLTTPKKMTSGAKIAAAAATGAV